MNSTTFTIFGDVNVVITLTELLDGSIRFDIEVVDDTGQIGDLNAIYFDLFDDSLTDGLTVSGTDVTGEAFKVDGVTKIDNFTNMNGEVVKDLGKFDGGVQFGTSGIAKDDIQSTSFVLMHDTADLTLADFSLQDFGVRLTSVGTIDGSREDSLKLGGTAPEFETIVDEPLHIAVNDTMTVTERETFNPPNFGSDPFVDVLDFGETSLLANDMTGDAAYQGTVTAAGGSPDAVGMIIPGSHGGALIVYPNGTVDFSAGNNPFDNAFTHLNAGETAQTTFEYGIEGGATAMLTVTVTGLSEGGDDQPWVTI